MKRRRFIQDTSLVAGTVSMMPSVLKSTQIFNSKIKLGFIGVGARGMATLTLALQRKDVEVVSVCDIDEIQMQAASERVVKSGQTKPQLFSNGPYDYQNLLTKSKPDAVIISTPWEWHTPMALDAISQKIAVGCEVAGAFSLEECWQLVRAVEANETPFMVLENVCYRRDVLAVLQMVRANLFGEIIHLEGGYQHDLRAVKFNNGKQLYGGGVEFGEKAYSEAKWRTQHSVHRNGDLYPTHGIGPIHNFLNINRGNRLVKMSSMASKSKGLHDYVVSHPAGGENHPNAKVTFKLGDIVVSTIQTQNGETIILTHDTNLPRPYSLGFRVQGTKGLWMDVNKSIYVEGISPSHQWENAAPYLDKYDHPLWKKYGDMVSTAGHGGMDFFVLHAFIEALKNDKPMPLDIYDHATWAAITCLSEQSIAEGGTVQYFPDFTNGKWMHKKPDFAFTDQY